MPETYFVTIQRCYPENWMAGVWPDKARERLGRIFWFCFRSVAMTDRMVQKAEAPCGVRKAPEIFWVYVIFSG